MSDSNLRHIDLSYVQGWSPDLFNRSIYLDGPGNGPGTEISKFNDDLVHCWELNDSVHQKVPDEIGTNHGTAYGDVRLGYYRWKTDDSSFPREKSDKCKSTLFDGIDDEIRIPNPVLGDSFTFSCWVKFEDDFNKVGNHVVLSQGTAADSSIWIGTTINESTGFLHAAVVEEGGLGKLTSDHYLVCSLWYNIVVTVDSGKIKLYLNGAEENSSELLNPIPDGTVVIGSLLSQNSFLKAALRDIYIWDTAISPKAVKELYGDEDGEYSFTNRGPNPLGKFVSETMYLEHDVTWGEHLAKKDSHLVAAYLMEETGGLPQDSKGSNHADETNMSEYYYYQRGKNRRGFYFYNGSYFRIPRMVSTDFSISIWFNPRAIDFSDNNWEYGKYLFGQTIASGSARVLGISLCRGCVAFGFYAPWTQLLSRPLRYDDRWHHVLATRDASTDKIQLFLDGELQGETYYLNDGAPLDGHDYFYVGREVSYYKRSLTGYLDELYIWDTVLGPSEAAELYNTGYGKFYGVSEITPRINELYNYKDNLKSVWSMSYGSINDSVGQANGIPIDAPSLESTGKIDKSISFNGSTSQRLKIDDSSEGIQLDLIPNSISKFSVSAWVYGNDWDNPSTNNEILFEEIGNSSTDKFKFWVGTDGKIGAGYSSYNGNYSSYRHYGYSDSVVPEGEWCHLAVVFDITKDMVSFYINGDLDNSVVFSNSSYRGWHQIGEGWYGHKKSIGGGFNGKLEQICIWKNALSAEAVKDLYNNNNGLALSSWYSTAAADAPQGKLYSLVIHPPVPWPGWGNSIKIRYSVEDRYLFGEMLTRENDNDWIEESGQDLRFRLIVDRELIVKQDFGESSQDIGSISQKAISVGQSFASSKDGMLDKLELYLENGSGSIPELIIDIYEGPDPDPHKLLGKAKFVPKIGEWNPIPVEEKYWGRTSVDRYRKYHIGSFPLSEDTGRRCNLRPGISSLLPAYEIRRTEGLIGGAAEFDGWAGGLVAECGTGLFRDFTMSLLFKAYETYGSYYLFREGLSNAYDSIELQIDEGILEFNYWQGNRHKVTLSTPIEALTIYSIVITGDGKTLNLYKNGNLEASGFFDGTLYNHGQNISARFGEYFVGWIQHINFWSCPLPEAQVNELYNHGNPVVYGNRGWVGPVCESNNGLISAYPLSNTSDEVDSNNLSNINSTIFVSGINDKAASFDVSKDQYLMSNGQTLEGRERLSISTWTKASPVSYFNNDSLDKFDKNLIAVWRLNGNGHEEINGLDAVPKDENPASRVPRWSVGLSGFALEIDENGYQSPLQSDWDEALRPGSISISLWARRNAWSPTHEEILFGIRGALKIGTYPNSHSTDPYEFVGFYRASDWTYLTFNPQSLGRRAVWYNIVFTYDGTFARLYFNGQLVSENSEGDNDPLEYTSPSNPWIGIGFDPDGSGICHYQTSISDVYMWNEAIDQDSVTALYNKGAGLFFNEIPDVTLLSRGDHSTRETSNYGISITNKKQIKATGFSIADQSWNAAINKYDDDLLAVWTLQEEGKEFLNLINGRVAAGYGPLRTRVKGAVNRMGVALDFASYIDCGRETYLKPTSGISISAWVRVDEWPSRYAQIVGNKFYQSGSHRGIGIFANDQMGIALVSGSRWEELRDGIFSGVSRTSTGGWFHIVAVQDSSGNALYIDGTRVDYSNQGMPSMDAGSEIEFNIGKMNYDGTDYHFVGAIHDVYVWSVKLDEEAVSALYNDGYGRFFESGETASYCPLILEAKADASSSYPQLYNRSLMGPELARLRLFYDEGRGVYSSIHEGPGGEEFLITLFPTTKDLHIESNRSSKSVEFNGSDAYLYVGATAALRPGSISISLWIRPDSLKNCGLIICREDLFTDSANWQVELQSDGDIKFSWYDIPSSSWKSFETSSGPVQTGAWSHIGVNYDGGVGNGKIYVNGVQGASSTGLPALNTSSSGYVQMGRGSTGYFDGLLDEIYIWDKKINDQDLISLYNRGDGRYYLSACEWTSELRSYNDKLVSVYSFEDIIDTLTDRVGVFDGVSSFSMYSNSLLGVDGISGKALEFNGNTQNYAYIPFYDDRGVYNALTISMWIKADSWSNTMTFLDTYSQDTSSGGDGLYIQHRGSNPIRFSMFFESAGMTEYNIEADSVISDTDHWHHIVVTWDGSTMKMFIDSIQQTDTELTNDPLINGFRSKTQIDIGRYNNNGSPLYPFDGKMDELYIWEEALPQAAIDDLYNNGRGRFYEPRPDPDTSWNDHLRAQDPNLVSLWHMRDRGPTADDVISKRTGTPSSGVTPGAHGIGNDSCFSFNGTNGYIDLSSWADVIPNSSVKWTLSVWLYAEQWGQDDGKSCLFYESSSSSSTLEKFALWVDSSGVVGMSYRDTPSGSSIDLGSSGSTTIPLNTWAHLTITVDTSAGTADIYLNGAQVGSKTFSGGSICSATASNTKTIAGRTPSISGSSQHFKGRMDELAIWSSVLTGSEVSTLFNDGHGRFYFPDIEWNNDLRASNSDLVSIWTLNEESGTFKDIISSHDATASGTIKYNKPGRGDLSGFWSLSPDQSSIFGTWSCEERSLNGVFSTGGTSVVSISASPAIMPEKIILDFSTDGEDPALGASGLGFDNVILLYDLGENTYRREYIDQNGNNYSFELRVDCLYLFIRKSTPQMSDLWEFSADSDLFGNWSCVRRVGSGVRKPVGTSSTLLVSGHNETELNSFDPVFWERSVFTEIIDFTKWNHIAFTFESNSKMIVYLNGEEQDELEIPEIDSLHSSPKSGPLFIGGYNDSMPDIDCDEIYIWKVGLSSERIGSLYNRGSGKFFRTEPTWTGPITTYDGDLFAVWSLRDLSEVKSDSLGSYPLTPIGGVYIHPEYGLGGIVQNFQSRMETGLVNDAASGLVNSRFSISIWFSSPYPADKGCILSFGTPDSGNGYSISYLGSCNSLLIKLNGSTSSEEILIPVDEPSSWNNLLLTVDGVLVNVCLNGAHKCSKTMAEGLNYGVNYFSIGASYDGSNLKDFYEGSLVEAYYWLLDLPIVASKYLYNNGRGRFFTAEAKEWSRALKEYDNEIISIWPLEEDGSDDRADSVGDYDLSPHGLSDPEAISGKFNSLACSFKKASKQYLDIPTVSAPDLNLGKNFTISVWVKLETEPSGYDAPILSKWGIGEKSYRLVIGLGNNKPRFDVSSSGNWEGTYVESTKSLHMGIWHHIAVTYEGSILRLFLDGVEENSLFYSETLKSSMRPFEVGAVAEDNEFLEGSVDELYIWGKALPSALIGELYRTRYLVPTDWSAGLEAYNQFLISAWDFDEKAGAPYDAMELRDLTQIDTSRVERGNGRALYFNGSTSRAYYEPELSLTRNLTQLTISFWVNVEASTGEDQYIFFESTDVLGISRFAIKFKESTNALLILIRDSSSGKPIQITTSSPLLFGTVYHVVLTVDTILNKIRLYLNGSLDNDKEVTVDNLDEAPSISQCVFGAYIDSDDSLDYYYKGWLDAFYIWKKILPSTEILELYNGGSGRFLQRTLATLDAKADYNLVIKCDPYPSLWTYSYVDLLVKDEITGEHYENNGTGWVSHHGKSIAFKLWVDGQKIIDREGGKYSAHLGMLGSGAHSVGEIFQMGVSTGDLEKIEINCSEVIGDGLPDLRLEIRRGRIIGEGELVAVGTIGSVNAPGWFSCTNFSPPAETSWSNFLRESDNSLKAVWHLEEETGSVIDSISSLTLQPNGTERIEAKNGFGRLFRSSHSEFLTNDGIELLRGETEVTISCWVLLNSIGTRQTIFWEGSSLASTPRFALAVDEFGAIEVQVRDDVGSFRIMKSVSKLSTGVIYHIIATVDTDLNLTKIYVDSSLWLESTTALDKLDSAQTSKGIRVGSSIGVDEIEFLDGVLDELYLWKEALSRTAVEELYNSGIGRFYSVNTSWTPTLQSFDEYLVSVWSLNESTGTRWDSRSFNQLDPGSGIGSYFEDGKFVAEFRDESHDSLRVLGSMSRGLDMTEDFSLFCWVYPLAYKTSILISKGNGFDINYKIEIDPLGVWSGVVQKSPLGMVVVVSNVKLPLNKWSFIGIVYNKSAGSLKLYQNDIEVGSSALSTNLRTNDLTTFSIGSGYDSNNDPMNFFVGRVGSVMIWSKPLSTEAISDLYNSGHGRIYENSNLDWTELVLGYSSVLVSSWKMEEVSGLLKDSARGNDGTPSVSGVTRGVVGKDGRAIALDGVNGYIDCGSSSELDLTLSFTIAMWIKPSRNWGSMICKGDLSSGNINYYILLDSGKLRFESWDGSSVYDHTFNLTINVGTWNFVALTYDGSELVMYRDADSESYSYSRVLTTDNEPLYIGARKSGTSIIDPFKGSMDEISVWSGALPKRVISDLYNNGLGTFLKDVEWDRNLEAEDANLYAAWDLNDRYEYDQNPTNKHDARSRVIRDRYDSRQDHISGYILRPNEKAYIRSVEVDEYSRSLIALYDFTETVTPVRDRIGDNHLAVIGDINLNVPGRFEEAGGGAMLYGSSSYFRTPATRFPSGDSPRTFALWVFITDAPSSSKLISYGDQTHSPRLFEFGFRNGNLYFSWYQNSYHEFSKLDFKWSAWNFVACRYDGSTVTMWLNDVSESLDISSLNTLQKTTLSVLSSGIGGLVSDLMCWGSPIPDSGLYELFSQNLVYDTSINHFVYRGVLQSPGMNGFGVGVRSDVSVGLQSDDPFDFSGPITISIWIKTLSYPGSGRKHLLVKGKKTISDGSRYGLSIDTIGRLIGWVVDQNGSYFEVVSYNSVLLLNDWVHVAYIFEPSTKSELYVNGLLVGSRSSDVPNSIGNKRTGNLYIGGKEGEAGFQENFDGEIDEVYIWEAVLGNYQVKQLYNEGVGRFYGYSYEVPEEEEYQPSSSSSSSSKSSSSSSFSSSSMRSDSSSSSSRSNSSSSSSSSSVSSSSISSSSESGSFGWV